MKYIDNLVEWGDKLFRRDTMESIQEATQIYILAANILGPRPEKIPPIVSQEPLTFQKMRHDLNLFSNFEVRLENLQVRRPFRINARPDVGGVTARAGDGDAVLLHAAQSAARQVLGHGGGSAVQDPQLHEHSGRRATAARCSIRRSIPASSCGPRRRASISAA